MENPEGEFEWLPAKQGLYDPAMEQDSCGVGMIADLTGSATRDTVVEALQVLENLDHRGARGCEFETGDGAGILCSMPDKFFRRVFKEQDGIDLPPPRQYAVGNVFFPSEGRKRADAKRIFMEYATSTEGVIFLGWRRVPVCSEGLGATAKAFEPCIEQCLLKADGESVHDEQAFEAALYTLRRISGAAIKKRLKTSFYICTLSCRVINYKGILTCPQLRTYFPDLQCEDFAAHVAIVHSRFSTNTFPSWQRAHPYRMLAHNGEINSIKGNTNWMKAREQLIASEKIPKLSQMFPLFEDDQTDSSQLDNIMDVLAVAGRPLSEIAVMMVPQAWEKTPFVPQEYREMYKVMASVMEPWDGPALLCFTDSDTAGACLDRNGLRPCRYYLTRSQKLICASEAGVLPNISAGEVVQKGRLRPGHILSVNFKDHKLSLNDEVKHALATAHPYAKWIKEEGFTIEDLQAHARRPARKFQWKGGLYAKTPTLDAEDGPRPGDPCDQSLRAFGYTEEALEMLLKPMATDGAEALGSMGNDTPLAVLSDLPRPVYDFFYQRFAQVSNPPLDPIRESMVMSLSAWVGPEQNLLAPLSPFHCRRLWLEHPCLLPKEMDAIYSIGGFRGWKVHVVDSTFPVSEGTRGMRRHLKRICNECCDSIRFGNCQIVVLSDRAVSRERAPIPALIGGGAVHQTLVKEKLRLNAALIIDSGEPHEVAHHCLLATFGVDAVCPYNAYEAILKMERDGEIVNKSDDKSKFEDTLFKNYQKAVGLGLMKVMAKMGISTLQSYKGAQIADPIGLDEEVTSLCFLGSSSQVGGFGLDDIATRTLQLHQRGFPLHMVPMHQLSTGLPNEGKYHLRQFGESEVHLNDPMVIAKLQEAARTNSRSAYAQFAQIHNRLISKTSLRGQLAFRNATEYDLSPVPLEDVEPASEIVKRFRTGAMSYGSISMEAHATLAIAMNRMGGLSNTGEGGEDPSRFEKMTDGNSANSAIKQVASGRFGVTIEYVTNSRELQIKMAQGAKPGEGGELPGWKVLPHIAKCRNSTPGVGLVSPPPHHDIYSIEDLAQLIHDLKCANPSSNVSVKLVSERGVGVVAAGVAKCKADHILISGCDGGTGASKWTGIKNTGAPWELGLAEAHQTLVLNGLRGRVSLETDGQLRTGRDVVIAALLGAEHFGFATAPLIAMGCIMMRKCHLNTCPVGIATQDPDLRKKFEGLPEHVVNYLMLVAEEARSLMAKLGFKTVSDMVGHAEALTVDPANFQVRPLELENLLVPARWLKDAGKIGKLEDRKLYDQDHSNIVPKGGLTERLLAGAEATIKSGSPSQLQITDVRNLERSIGATLSHELCKAWGSKLEAGTCHVKMTGTAGQSFGAFAGKGMFLELEGDSQDYFGKALSGGLLAIYPPQVALDKGFKSEENVIIGNVALYGATMGAAFIRGVCSERFAVRNSGVWAVVEGAGDHCCEYMTGGRIVVLGETGSNFGAGMSGGVAWVYDPNMKFEQQVAKGGLELSRMSADQKHEAYPHDADDLKLLLENHAKFTKSAVASRILAEWPAALGSFVRVFPEDYRNALKCTDKGVAATEAFKQWIPGAATAAPQEAPSKPVSPFTFPDIEETGALGKGLRPKTTEIEAAATAGPAGFKKFDRAEISKREVTARAADFLEVYEHKDEAKVRTQAARCMDCGTPFCHQSVTNRSGCPLGNLIPEWNALVKKGHWHQAFQRLRATNNFPEFTGRVCPAPCEAACTLGIIDDAVSIKSIELMIVDKAYEMGWMEPCPPPMRTGKRVAVIGSGPAGLAAADELNKMGHSVTVFERADRVGGLMMYGVPNMKADKADVVQRRVDIMQQEGVEFVTGKGGNVGAEGGPTAASLMDSNDAVLLACGATVGRDLKNLPGRNLQGVHLAMEYLHGSTQALLDNGNVAQGWRQGWGTGSTPLDAKGKRVIIIGGGDTGNDCIGTAVRQGAKSIVNLELMPKPPPTRSPSTPWPHWPTMAKVDYGHEEAAQQCNAGEDIRQFSVSTKEFIGDDSGNITAIKVVDLEWTHAEGRAVMKEVPGSERVLQADMVLLALGFLGVETPIAEAFGVSTERGNVSATFQKVERDFRTSNPKVFAAGDCRRGQSLVVWAITEGREASKAIHKTIMA
jgi:glutamate synthase (NADPH/NADH)